MSYTFSDELTEQERELGFEVKNVIDPDGTGGVLLEAAQVEAVVLTISPSRRIIKLAGNCYRLEIYGRFNPDGTAHWNGFVDDVASPDPGLAIMNAQVRSVQKPGPRYEEEAAPAAS
jgi:hypothetical protein